MGAGSGVPTNIVGPQSKRVHMTQGSATRLLRGLSTYQILMCRNGSTLPGHLGHSPANVLETCVVCDVPACGLRSDDPDLPEMT